LRAFGTHEVPSTGDGRNVLTRANSATASGAIGAASSDGDRQAADGPLLGQVCLTGTLCHSNEGDASGVGRKIDYQGPPDDRGRKSVR